MAEASETRGPRSPPETIETATVEVQSFDNKDFGFLPIPAYLRYYEGRPQKFGLMLQIVFGFSSTFTVANLYYCQPLLITLAQAFGVSHSEVSRIPTLTQAGYAVGLILVAPMGDLLRRRPLLLFLVLISGSLSIALAITNSVLVFEVISFFIGILTVTPQVLVPLAADLAPPHRRAASIAVVYSGLLFGILLARVLAGVIAQFSSWRNVYFMAVGVQYMILIVLYFVLPDFPAKSPELGYLGILISMAKFAVTEPILIQGCLVSCSSSACFTNFWVTLTFLLGGAPYHYTEYLDTYHRDSHSPVLGLFGLVGMLGVMAAPLVGRFVDTLVPWNASVLATLFLLVFQSVQTAAGGINIGAVIVATFGLDVFRQMQQVSLSASILGIDPRARSRLNSVYIFSIFLGQLMGTAAGTRVFLQHGWRAAAALSMGWMGFQLGILLLRGPHVPRKRWIGWKGGWTLRREEDGDTKAAQDDREKGRSPSYDDAKGQKQAEAEVGE